MTQNEISRRFYQNRKRNGLCPRCGRALDREGHYCKSCLEKVNAYQREKKEFCRNNKICTVCFKQKVYGNEKICPECRAKLSNRNPPTDEQRSRYNQRFRNNQKIIYRDRKNTGICTRCGKRPAAPMRAKCQLCLDKNRISKYNK